MAESRPMSATGSVPVPDPTTLTTQQLVQRITGLKDLIDAQLEALREDIARHMKLIDEVPGQIDTRIGELEKLINERFKSVGTQFEQRDVAVAAALQAAEKAVGAQNAASTMAIGKSEAATAKQLDQLETNTKTMVSASDTKIDAVRDRVGTLENRIGGFEQRGVGTQELKAGQNTSNTLAIAIIGVVISSVAVVAMLIDIFTRHTGLP